MGVFTRDDSPFYWLWLEGTKTRENTKIPIAGATDQQKRENRRNADLAYQIRMVEIAREKYDLPQARPVASFRAFVAWYEEHELPRHRGAEREREILPHLVEVFGRYPLAEIDPHLVQEKWITPRLTKGREIEAGPRVKARQLAPASPNTVNREVDVLKAVLQAGVPKYLKASPLFGMKRLRVTTPKRRLLSQAEERRLLAVMTLDDRVLMLMGLDTLARLGDILDVRRRDDQGGVLWIADPKAGGGFHVPISRRLRRALDALYRATTIEPLDYLFRKRRIAKTPRDRRNGVRQMLERYCAMTSPPIPYGRKIGGLTFHWSTRRTGATRMLESGVALGTVQKIGRWQTPAVVLGIYHEMTDQAAKSAVETVGRRTRTPREPDGSRTPPRTAHRPPTRRHRQRLDHAK